MSRDYQFDRISYDPYDQNFDSGFNEQSREYRDLYNPNKNIWNQALRSKSFTLADRSKHNLYRQEEPHRPAPERSSVPKQANAPRERQNRPVANIYTNISQSEEVIFDSGYDVTKRNTYGYRTTGYGPRD